MAVIARSRPRLPLDNPPATLDTDPMPKPEATADTILAELDTPSGEASHIGRMTITLIDNGTSLPHPVVTFDPVGRFTERFMEHYLTHFAQEIQRAQSAARFAIQHGRPRGAPITEEEAYAPSVD